MDKPKKLANAGPIVAIEIEIIKISTNLVGIKIPPSKYKKFSRSHIISSAVAAVANAKKTPVSEIL